MISITWVEVSKLHLVISIGKLRIFYVGDTPMAFAAHDRDLGIITTGMSALRKIRTKFVVQFRSDPLTVGEWASMNIDNEIRSVGEFRQLLAEAVEYECLQIGAEIGKKYLRLIK